MQAVSAGAGMSGGDGLAARANARVIARYSAGPPERRGARGGQRVPLFLRTTRGHVLHTAGLPPAQTPMKPSPPITVPNQETPALARLPELTWCRRVPENHRPQLDLRRTLTSWTYR
jgi:hypothetical protein